MPSEGGRQTVRFDQAVERLAARTGRISYRPTPGRLRELRAAAPLRPGPPTSMARAVVRRLGFEFRPEYPWDFDESLRQTIDRVHPYTLTTYERIAVLCDAVRHVVSEHVSGALVECGVWRGGSMMAAALTLNELDAGDRSLVLFDTFLGMPAPTARDVKAGGDSASTWQKWRRLARGDANEWCYAPLDEVRGNLARTGYDMNRVELVKGQVEETLPARAPESIALLRLDTDWYESTKHELETLYPRLEPGGILILDDYGEWQGVREAFDEYFQGRGSTPYLTRVDASCRVGVKPLA